MSGPGNLSVALSWFIEVLGFWNAKGEREANSSTLDLIGNNSRTFVQQGFQKAPRMGVYFKAGSPARKRLQSTRASAIPGADFFPP
jgi:hypothetical protein